MKNKLAVANHTMDEINSACQDQLKKVYDDKANEFHKNGKANMFNEWLKIQIKRRVEIIKIIVEENEEVSANPERARNQHY